MSEDTKQKIQIAELLDLRVLLRRLENDPDVKATDVFAVMAARMVMEDLLKKRTSN